MQAAAQTDRQNALSKLAELEGILQQALDQRAQATEEAHTAQTQLTKKITELSAAQQQLQQQQQDLAILQVQPLKPSVCNALSCACCTSVASVI